MFLGLVAGMTIVQAVPDTRDTARPVVRGRTSDPVIAAAGDIACPDEPCQDQQDTADLIVALDPTVVLALGDTQYDWGALSHYNASYDPTWGQFKGITHAVPGNHDYETPDAEGYFSYFGNRAHGPRGYYSFDVGRWHLIALNSGRHWIERRQLRWLRRDLSSDDHGCELAYWHHPRWSSGTTHGSDDGMAPLWRILFAQGVDVVLNGHEHNYERFARMDPDGEPDRQGIREFVVGTGGKSSYPFGSPIAGSQGRIQAFGVLALVLHSRSYSWEFLSTDGTSPDSGRADCHA